MKQTATEWLFEQLWEAPKDKLTWNSILMKAKAMEKEQIKERMYSEEDVIAIVEKSRVTGLTAEYLLLQIKEDKQ